MKASRTGSAGLLLLLGFPCGVHASDAPQDRAAPAALKSMSLEELSKIEVTSTSKEASPAFRNPAAIFILTSDDIRRSGATNIPDLLRLAPGVEVAQIDGVKYAIGIRGFQGRLSRAVLVLIDGRSVYTPLFAGVYWESQNTLIQDIDRIEVIRGPGGTVWGSNAVNGVINIITKSSKDTRGDLVTAGGGNVDQGFLGVRHGGGTDRLSYRGYAQGFTRGPQFHQDRRNFDDSRMGQAGFRMDWAASARDSLTLQGDVYESAAGQYLGISTFSPPALNNAQGNIGLYGQNFLGAWRRTLRGGSDFQIRTYYDRTDRQDLNYREIRHTFDFDFIHHKPFERHDIIWGAGLRVSPSRFFQTVPTVDFLPHTQTYTVYSGFIQDDMSLVRDRLSFTVGTKVERNSFSGFEIQPSGRLSWTPDEEHTVWASITRAVRTPSRIEEGFQFNALSQPALPLYIRLVGDGQFTPEQMLGYELGYRNYFRRNGFLNISTFFNRYTDLLSVDSRPAFAEPSPTPVHLVLPLYLRNGVKAETAGVEVAGLLDLRAWWRLRGSYSYLALNAKNRPVTNDASTVRQLEGDSPSHKVVIQSMFTLWHGVDVGLAYRYVSALPDQKVAAYSTGDANIAWRLAHDWQVSLVGRNLMQPYHFEYGGNPGPLVGIKRAGYLKLTWSR
jgi:iron complex outermembrane receptor protein